MSYSSCPSHPVQQACRGCSMEDADHLIRRRLEAFKGADLATRVAADLFAHAGDFRMWCEEEANATALKAVRFGRIFAEAVAKEGK